MKGMVLSQLAGLINVIGPQNVAGGVVGDRFSMKGHSHATILVQIGAATAAPGAITVKECDAATAGTANAISFSAADTAPGTDQFGALAEYAAAGITATDDDDVIYAIEVDAQQLTEGFPFVEVEVATGGACQMSVVGVLTGTRYAEAENASALS